jgi:hypothetical protein
MHFAEAGAAPSTPVGQLTNINRSMHGIHNRQEDITAGYRLPAQSGITRADAIAAARSQQPMQTAAQAVARQNDVGLGLTHGMADAAKTHESNIGALADNFANPDLRRRNTLHIRDVLKLFRREPERDGLAGCGLG